MMVFRKRRLWFAGGVLVIMLLLAYFAATDTEGRLRYLLTWDPKPAGSGSAGAGTGGAGTAGTGTTGTGSSGAGVAGGGEATGAAGGGATAVPGADFFVDFRLERERTRGQQLEYLREMINNTKVDEGSRKSAAAQWLDLTKQIGKELELEGLIKAKGWPDCVVFIQAQSCTVVVKAEKLTQSDAARVGDIVVRGTGLAPQAISISARTD